MHAITVSVNYSDLLSLTLPYNRHHFSHYTIITTPKDAPNVCPIADANDAQVLTTDLFYYQGAAFAKWLALEWGLSQIGRKGWLCLLDADVLWPKDASLVRILRPGYLYSPLRRMYPTIPRTASEIPPESEWGKYPIHRNISEWAGYSQCFSANDPVLGNPPWHQVDWKMANGGDSFFQAKWPRECKIRPDWHVLHLGPCATNWAGRASPYADGTVPPDSEKKLEEIRRLIGLRRSVPNDPYYHEKIR